MTRESANRALVNAMRKRGAPMIAAAAKLLTEAHRSRKPAVTAGVVLRKESEAYAVQDAVYADLWPGTRPAAWKVGGPSDKVEPTAAPIPPENLLLSPASVLSAKLQMIGVEAEVAFRLAKDLPPRTRPYSAKAVAAAVGEVLVTIELCDTRLVDWKKTSGLWKLADFQTNSAHRRQRHEELAQDRIPRSGSRVPHRCARLEGERRPPVRQSAAAAALARRALREARPRAARGRRHHHGRLDGARDREARRRGDREISRHRRGDGPDHLTWN